MAHPGSHSYGALMPCRALWSWKPRLHTPGSNRESNTQPRRAWALEGPLTEAAPPMLGAPICAAGMGGAAPMRRVGQFHAGAKHCQHQGAASLSGDKVIPEGGRGSHVWKRPLVKHVRTARQVQGKEV
eukprot:scaffold81974_cov19-Tisochrysis_lutea.AAC.3